MTPKSRAEILIDDLDRDLGKVVGIERVSEVTGFSESGQRAVYWVRPRFILADHFDPAPAILLHDSARGTLGIVEVVLPSLAPAALGVAPDDAVKALVRRHVDSAAYVRHLLVRAMKNESRPATTVELVLVTGDADAAEEDAKHLIFDALTEISRDTDSLYQVGIGVLAHAGGADGYRGRLRRAFPWLLAATRKWFSSPYSRMPVPNDRAADVKTESKQEATKAPKSTESPERFSGRLRGIVLSNYRFARRRAIELADARVHLMHGANGTGKSSIVEALELASCGHVTRLRTADETDYTSAIQREGSVDPARIELSFRNGTDEKTPLTVPPETVRNFVVTQTGIEGALDPLVDSCSFRLDQPFMERLVAQGQYERANVFLQAFFSGEERESLEKHARIEGERRVALEALAGVIDTLEAAKKALEAVSSWRSGASIPSARDFTSLLNEWLEKTALCDVVLRELSVRSTLGAAREAGWNPTGPLPTFLSRAPSADDARLEQDASALMRDTELLRRELASFSPSPSTAAAGSDPAKLDSTQYSKLDAVGEWLFGPDVVRQFGKFGEKLSAALTGRGDSTYGTLVIGADEWTVPVTRELDAMLSACRAFGPDKPAPSWPGKSPCPAFDDAAALQTSFLDAGRMSEQQLISHFRAGADPNNEFDGSLGAALNELLALFTPARWNYEEIFVESTTDEHGRGFGISHRGTSRRIRADLRLNTAQLNLFTVAIFLLCTSRVSNPLGLLLFDDPLQNMDELTSTALARGLAKLVRLPRSEGLSPDLLLLFHGADDLERFHAELPAAIYRLPWLSGSEESEKHPIRPQTTRCAIEETQSLKKLFGPYE